MGRHTATTAPALLRAIDRCDKGCNRRSVVRVHYGSSSFDLCGPHFADIEATAVSTKVEISEVLGHPSHIQDERPRIRAEEDKREGVG